MHAPTLHAPEASPPFSPDDIASAIDRECAYLASLQETNVINLSPIPPRGGSFTSMRTSLDQLSDALEALILTIGSIDHDVTNRF